MTGVDSFKRSSAIGVACVLLVGVGMVIVGEIVFARTPAGLHTLANIGTAVQGWDVQAVPLSDIPEQAQVVKDTLRYDSAIYLRYFQNDVRIDLYAAYWKRGKVPVYMVARHTPDVCWSASGWNCVEKRKVLGNLIEKDKSVGPSEYRTFVAAGQTEHLVFFHFIDGQSSTLAETDQGLSATVKWVNNLFRNELIFWHIGGNTAGNPDRKNSAVPLSKGLTETLSQRKEQLFVRISSNRPYDEFWSTPVVSHFFQQLPIQANSVLPADQ